MEIQIADQIPSFSTIDQDGNSITKRELEGRNWIMFFFPSELNLECLKVLHSLHSHLGEFDDYETGVIGISSKNCDEQRKFLAKHQFTIPLLCDEHLEVSRNFGVVKDDTVIPSIIIIDVVGTILSIETPVKFEGLIDRILQTI